ncbi:MAG: helix-turn-helix domain-containing protein [Hyphomicrobiaceae bacterium]
MCADDGKTVWFTVPEVADRYKMDDRTIWRWVAAGKLRAHKFGRAVRISEQDLLDFEKASRR